MTKRLVDMAPWGVVLSGGYEFRLGGHGQLIRRRGAMEFSCGHREPDRKAEARSRRWSLAPGSVGPLPLRPWRPSSTN